MARRGNTSRRQQQQQLKQQQQKQRDHPSTVIGDISLDQAAAVDANREGRVMEEAAPAGVPRGPSEVKGDCLLERAKQRSARGVLATVCGDYRCFTRAWAHQAMRLDPVGFRRRLENLGLEVPDVVDFRQVR